VSHDQKWRLPARRAAAVAAMKGQNSLQVEACALGKFFCSGNRWSRIDVQPARLITYRQISSQPRS
jgi:hypothetical protein